MWSLWVGVLLRWMMRVIQLRSFVAEQAEGKVGDEET